jgi:hypothetical protein
MIADSDWFMGAFAFGKTLGRGRGHGFVDEL